MNLFIYLLKVILVSAIFFGYYRFFLRNKRFHHYNRFFLLSALLLSVVLPFIRIPVLYQPENPVNEAVYRTAAVINADYGEDEPDMTGTAAVNEPVFTLVNSIYLVYGIGALFLLTLIIKSLLYIRSLRKRYPAEQITSLRFYVTQEPGTPFSFFRSVFWNHRLPFNSLEGQQIFRHELFHVQHRHSADRLLSELLTAVFWFNPFFHFIKKELKAIHEFLADQFAVSGNDRYAYATLLVQQALEPGKHAVTNHFFQNHIKRRIAMITQFQKSNYGYWSRMMILPVSLLLFFAITLYAKKTDDRTVVKMTAAEWEQPLTVLVDAGHGGADNGATSQDGSIREKDLTLQISRKIQELAAGMNIRVVLAREGDHLAGNKASKPDALRYTTSLIAEVKPDAVVSVHVGTVYAEGATSSAKNGIDIYITARNQASLPSSRSLGEKLIGSLAPVYTVNPALRQRKSEGIWVLDNSAPPTILIECGYLSNEKDLAFISDEANQEKIAGAILRGIIDYKKNAPTAAPVDTIPGKEAREKELLKLRQAQLEEVRKKMKEHETVIKKARLQELEQIKKQMQEQEILSREQEVMQQKQAREMMALKRELITRQQLAENQRKKQMAEIESLSERQMLIQKERQAELEILKSKLKERMIEQKKEQEELLENYRQQLRKEQEEKNRTIREKKTGDEQSGLKPPTSHWVMLQADSLLRNVIRHYHRNLRYPDPAMKHNAQGQVYFSVLVDQNGRFKDFVAYAGKPSAKDIKDIVVVGQTPAAATDESLGLARTKDVFTEEIKRATDRANNNPVVHPVERTYFFRVVFKLEDLEDHTFRWGKLSGQKPSTSLFVKKEIERRKPLMANKQNSKPFAPKKTTLLRTKKNLDMLKKPIKAKSAVGSGQMIDGQQEEENFSKQP